MNFELSHVDLRKARQGLGKLAFSLGEILCGMGLHYWETQYDGLSSCLRCGDRKARSQWARFFSKIVYLSILGLGLFAGGATLVAIQAVWAQWAQ